MSPRIALSVYGGTGPSAAFVSGLRKYQLSYASMLSAAGLEVIPFYFDEIGSRPWTRDNLYEQLPTGEHRFYIQRATRIMALPAQAAREGVPYSPMSSHLTEELTTFLRRNSIDALSIVEWLPTGMALWQAALEFEKPVVFTPTEHGAVCQYSFLLQNCGVACSGPDDGSKCGRCTHSLEPYPPIEEAPVWYSRRHRMFHRATSFLPSSLQRHALWQLSEHFQYPGAAISEAHGRARVSSARRFLRSPRISVQYQTPHQHGLFQRVLACVLPATLPMHMPSSDINLPVRLDPQSDRRAASDRFPVRFLFAARPDFDRGLWLLLEAWKQWKPSPRIASLQVYTHRRGDWLDRIVGAINRDSATVEVHYEVLNKERLLELHNAIHFVVNPAVWEEPGSATVSEAMVLGTPCIVPTRTGSSDFIMDGENGYLFSFRDCDDLVATLERAVAARDDWPALHQQALRTGERLRQLSFQSLTENIQALVPGFSPNPAVFEAQPGLV